MDEKLARLRLELGNAITAIKLANEVLLRTRQDPAAQRHLQVIAAQSDRAWALVQALVGALDPQPPRVVVVDDHEDHREALLLLLEDRGYRTAGFGTATEALEDQALQGPAALYLLDLTLPDLPGERLVAELRARGVEAPVVVVSGREPAPVQGASALLAKPVDLAKLERLLATLAPLP